ncbi:AbrB family transcriptional regulator [Alkalihalobacillus sp. MEB130]|uniref:AbrB family transcriptional regulator n=1 Tax=Alkalihalobacillus sp. MEB130 TaxID=2976704 RepID=UPI0028DF69FA|nr:AbrB family transcriptional regulator [Alkalihalobacillus sp. MEB130]MDT8861262.1 AbrB family transcriptional regulator [Alkalihalobacillus sp. MEB130]
MKTGDFLRLMETVILGLLGGYLFNIANLPLPWVLGSLTAVMLWQGFTKRQAHWPSFIKNSGLIILGIYFGLYFTIETFTMIGPYLFAFLFLTILLIATSIFISSYITKWIDVDKITSVFGSIPGGLTEMVIASESLNAKSSLVVIFQTVRLITVLFIVPAAIIFYFSQIVTPSVATSTTDFSLGGWDYRYLWFILPVIAGILCRNKIPAGVVIGPLAVTALLNMSVVELSSVHPFFLLMAQVAVGIGLGKNISFSDLKMGGKFSIVYFGVSISLIVVSFVLGVILAQTTSLDLATAILSLAPGGLIEMVLTASIVGADPAIVSAFQLIRILIIIIFVPPFLKWYFRKTVTQNAA